MINFDMPSTEIKFKPRTGDSLEFQSMPIWEPDVVSAASNAGAAAVPKSRSHASSRCFACDFDNAVVEERIYIKVVDDNDVPTGSYWELRGEQIENVSKKIGLDVRKAESVRMSMLPNEVVNV